MEKRFEYHALTQNGEKIESLFDGTDEEFFRMVSEKNITVTEYKITKNQMDKGRYKFEDFVSFIEEMYYLTNSGMSIDQSIKVLIKSSKKESTIRVLKSLLLSLKSGDQFSIALKKSFEKENVIIDELSISFLSTAEEVGDLSNGLLQLLST